MHNAMKIAKWEIKRNLKNKSFLIGLFLTPVLIFGIWFIGGVFDDSDDGAADDSVDVLVNDELDVFGAVEDIAAEAELDWNLEQTDVSEAKAEEEVADTDDTAYIFMNEEALEDETISVYTSDDMPVSFMDTVQVLSTPVKDMQLEKLDLSDEERAALSTPIAFTDQTVDDSEATVDNEETAGEAFGMSEEEIEQRLVTGGFAGIILLSIIISGMYIFQSASQEKKDKISEIILSSVTPGELMQGKIIGYFVLGMIQALVLLAFAVPFTMWKLDTDVFNYLFTPETGLLVALALMGYLLFASLFVGIGATISDAASAGQFQGIVLMLPFLPFIFIGPVASDPGGMLAQIGSYIPFTAPGVLILRLSIMDTWPWTEILISLVILVVSIWLVMKLAGKIFKVGILMYGKNATPKEILKWIRA